jgi:hypothetical protein
MLMFGMPREIGAPQNGCKTQRAGPDGLGTFFGAHVEMLERESHSLCIVGVA